MSATATAISAPVFLRCMQLTLHRSRKPVEMGWHGARAMLAGPASPGRPPERDHGERGMAEQGRPDRELIERAAARLRADAIAASYAGRERKDLAFAVALLL